MSTMYPDKSRVFTAAMVVVLLAGSAMAESLVVSTETRTRVGLVALYDFSSAEGERVLDRSGVGEAADLYIEKSNAALWELGGLTLTGNNRIRTKDRPAKLSDSMAWTGEVTIEAWVQPANLEQKGPARIVTFSQNGSSRNFTLGQDSGHYDVRFRTTTTTGNGIPSLPSAEASLSTEPTHVVYTRDRAGRAKLYLNGVLSKEERIPGGLSAWNDGYHLALGNELSDERPWLGTYYLVALYNRALRPLEVEENFGAGLDAPTGAVAEDTPALRSARLFAHNVAPILAKHCLECHDPNKRKGDLDLSSQSGLMEGDPAEPFLVAGDITKSLVWTTVESDEMPKKRDPLSVEEKAALREWIETGAVWSHERIDPAVYSRDADAATYLRRLTVDEYIATVKNTLDVDIAAEAQEMLPVDLRADGFSNTAYNLNVDLKHVNAYGQLAEIVAGKMDVLAFAATFSEKQGLKEKVMRRLVEKMGTWLLRGPMEDHEITSYAGIPAAVVSSGGDYEEAVRYVIEAMLQSPRFIYRVENQRGDNDAWPVSDYELASRLSYTIWGASPDLDLIRAARTGKLYDPVRLAKHVDRMLDDPRAIAHSKKFAYEWLNLGRLNNLRPSPTTFPDWEPQLAVDMQEETLAFFEDVVWDQERPLSDLFNAQLSYMTPELAKHYGVPAEGENLMRYDLAEIPARGGLLTQGSLLTVGGDEASMVSRGLFVLHDILRGTVNDPPPGLDITPVPPSPGQSHRNISESRIKMKACGGCHVAFEPLAFGLEKFDGLGSFQEKDAHENALREDGDILFPGTADPVPYKTTAELMDILAGSDRVRETLAWKVAQFSVGRPLGPDDVSLLEGIHRDSQRNGGTYASLIKAIVLSDLIQTTPTEAHP